MTHDDLLSVRRKVLAAARALGVNTPPNLVYYIEQAATLFTLSKWNVGDRVELGVTPQIDDKHAWGWMNAKHFLVDGARAVVMDVHFANGAFMYSLTFDSETWRDCDGKLHPVTEKALYSIPEAWLRSHTATA